MDSALETPAVALVFRTTKHAEARCKAQTIQDVQKGVLNYLTKHGVAAVAVGDANSVLTVTIDRPFTKPLKVILRLRNRNGAPSWNKVVEPSGWHATRKALKEIDHAIEASPLMSKTNAASN